MTCDHSVNLGEQGLRNRDLCHLERDMNHAWPTIFAPILISFSFKRRQRPVLDRFGRAETVGERRKLRHGPGSIALPHRSRLCPGELSPEKP